ncbi:MAG: 1-deoxy-D-xylulose-5-phosphate reductoisomerase [Planctomycetes bacterium]|nr:1-deoxy-D-xylulose-5-phosphate reductoisomerase [Planctomycetota bacterium]
MKRIVVLGSTGSIGESTLRLVAEQRNRFKVVGLSARRNAGRLMEQAEAFDVRMVALAEPDAVAGDAKNRLAQGKIKLFGGERSSAELLEAADFDLCIHGITGAAGLPASHACLQKGRALALANKESLVIAGELLLSLSRATGAPILPVDSEHSAIFQCVRHEPRSRIRKIYLTASGGPFRDRALDAFATITRDEALKHPNWDMGERITVGSATMMNKAFEVIEAHHMFQLQSEQIRVLIHRQSIVHSMVEFEDGSMLAQLGVPDMRIPIQVALHHPDRGQFDFEPFDPVRFSNLTFSEAERDRYPCLALGYKCIKLGGTAGAVLNAADEVATQRFLDGSIRFPDIARICEAALREIPIQRADTLAAVFAADARARDFARSFATKPS